MRISDCLSSLYLSFSFTNIFLTEEEDDDDDDDDELSRLFLDIKIKFKKKIIF